MVLNWPKNNELVDFINEILIVVHLNDQCREESYLVELYEGIHESCSFG